MAPCVEIVRRVRQDDSRWGQRHPAPEVGDVSRVERFSRRVELAGRPVFTGVKIREPHVEAERIERARDGAVASARIENPTGHRDSGALEPDDNRGDVLARRWVMIAANSVVAAQAEAAVHGAAADLLASTPVQIASTVSGVGRMMNHGLRSLWTVNQSGSADRRASSPQVRDALCPATRCG